MIRNKKYKPQETKPQKPKAPSVYDLLDQRSVAWSERKEISYKDILDICENEEIVKRHFESMETKKMNSATANRKLFLALHLQLLRCPILLEGEGPIKTEADGEWNNVKIAVFIDGKWKDIRKDMAIFIESLKGTNPIPRRYKRYFSVKRGQESDFKDLLTKVFWLYHHNTNFTTKSVDEAIQEKLNWRFKKYYLDVPQGKGPKNEDEEINLTRKIYGMRQLPKP